MASFKNLLTTVLVVSVYAANVGDDCYDESDCLLTGVACKGQTELGDGTVPYAYYNMEDASWLKVYQGGHNTCGLNGVADFENWSEDTQYCYREYLYQNLDEEQTCQLYPILQEGTFGGMELIDDGQAQPPCNGDICGHFKGRTWRCLQDDGSEGYKGVDFAKGEEGVCIEIQSIFGEDKTDTQYCHANRRDNIYENVAIEADGKCKLKVEAGGQCNYLGELGSDQWTLDSYHCLDGTICDNTGDDLYLCKYEKGEGEECADQSTTVCRDSLECLLNGSSPATCKTPVSPLDLDADCSDTTTTFCSDDSLCDPRDYKCKVPDGGECADDAICLSTSNCSDGICEPLVPFGGACDEELMCASDAECVDGTCVVPHGGDCSVYGAVCRHGDECIDGNCVVPHGGDCWADIAVCPPGDECVEDFCTTPYGGICIAETSVCPYGGACLPNGEPTPDTCKEEKDEGGDCADTTKTICKDGLECHDDKCKMARERDESCDEDTSFCTDGLVCYDGACQEDVPSSATTTFALTSVALYALGAML